MQRSFVSVILPPPPPAGKAYEEPRLTCWYGELPYTYARSTMAANTQV